MLAAAPRLPDPPKSACIACLYAFDARSGELRDQTHQEFKFADAVPFDDQVREHMAVQGFVKCAAYLPPLAPRSPW
jgi:hypothetical protein